MCADAGQPAPQRFERLDALRRLPRLQRELLDPQAQRGQPCARALTVQPGDGGIGHERDQLRAAFACGHEVGGVLEEIRSDVDRVGT